MKNAYPIDLIVRTSLESLPTHAAHGAEWFSRDTQNNETSDVPLHLLKRRMLLSALEQTPDTGLFKRLCGAANQAAELAWSTRAPARTFPVFFEDLILAIQQDSIRL